MLIIMVIIASIIEFSISIFVISESTTHQTTCAYGIAICMNGIEIWYVSLLALIPKL
jgi:putative exporter of polyketide antibiotics